MLSETKHLGLANETLRCAQDDKGVLRMKIIGMQERVHTYLTHLAAAGGAREKGYDQLQSTLTC
jgi:hypothetical protein